jgi:hypothetical protein
MNLKDVNNCVKTEKIFEDLTSMILSRSIEVSVKNNNPLTKVFYIGIGKTGSSSLKKYIDETVAHWHDEQYFETIYQTDMLTKNGIYLYDLILYIGNKYQFKPLIIESYREPVARSISGLAHRNRISETSTTSYGEFKNQLTVELIKSTSEPYSIKWKSYFSVDLIAEFKKTSNYFFKDLKDAKLLFLKLEDVNNWPSIIEIAGYHYENIISNDATKSKFSDFYTEIVSKFSLSEEALNRIYDDRFVESFYNECGIDAFKEKWRSLQ